MESMVRNENFEWIGPFTKLSDEMFSTSKLKLSAPRSLVRNLKIYIFKLIFKYIFHNFVKLGPYSEHFIFIVTYEWAR